MLFILMFLTLWTISFIIWRHARGTGYVHWTAALFLLGGLRQLLRVDDPRHPAFLREHTVAPSLLLETGRVIGIAAIHLYYHLIFYTFLMKSVMISGLFAKRTTVWIGLAAFVIPLWSLLSQPGYYPVTVLNVQLIAVWTAVYFLAGVTCYVIGSIRESNAVLKRNMLRTGAIVNTALLLAYVSDFYSVASVTIDDKDIMFANGNHWNANSLIVLWILILFVIFALRYGIFGVRLKIEQQKLDYSIRALTKGTAILNHALKNEVVKINLIGEQVQHLLDRDEKAAAKETVMHLFQITDRMTALFRKIGDQTEEIVLKKEPVRVNLLVDSIAAQLRRLPRAKEYPSAAPTCATWR
ncbi:hypothetical protein LJK88_46590 [Paenibacillus sp. P26]|nr:hypothetical protein LJK88_46590 [Paenibacillus sp. P26]